MLSTGDVQGCLRKLETLLRVIKYPGHVDYSGLSKGDPSAFLPILSFTLTSFSPPFAEQLVAAGLELTGKTDLRFTDTLYKVLRDIFHYKPVLSKQQFLQLGFSQRKICAVCDIINLVQKRHNQLKKPRIRYATTHMYSREEAHPTPTNPVPVSNRPIVVNHLQSPSDFPTNPCYKEEFSCHDVTSPSHDEEHSSDSPNNGIAPLTGGEENKDDILHSSEVEGRFSAVEAKLDSLLLGLDRLSVLENRLEDLERRSNTDKNEEPVITISRQSWENLMSRVTLLETKLELSSTKSSVLPLCQSSTSSGSSSSMSGVSKEDLNERLERITNLLKTTTSVMKSTESSSRPCT